VVRTPSRRAATNFVLATDDEYLAIGTRAWVYYQHKDAALRRERIRMEPKGGSTP
jgi:hypothetical protein